MKNLQDIVLSITAANPKLTIDSVQADGDVLFHISLKECGLNKDDCLNPIMYTRFFVNFIGELLVRTNILEFSSILTGLDHALYKKMVNSCEHRDFGMVVNQKLSIMTFQMHISLVQEILTEEFSKTSDEINPPTNNILNDFDASKQDND